MVYTPPGSCPFKPVTCKHFNILPPRSNANNKVIDKQYTCVLFYRVFVYTEPRSATRKSRPVYPAGPELRREPRRALPAPLPFLLSSHSSLFFSEGCSLFSVTAVSQLFVYQSLRHSFHRDGGAHPSSQELCAIFASCSSPVHVPPSKPFRPPRPLRAPKPLRSIDLQKSIKAKDFNFIWNDRLTKNREGRGCYG